MEGGVTENLKEFEAEKEEILAGTTPAMPGTTPGTTLCVSIKLVCSLIFGLGICVLFFLIFVYFWDFSRLFF